MTGDIGVVITSFVGVVMILRGLGSIISKRIFNSEERWLHALRVWPGERDALYALNLRGSSFERLLAAITIPTAELGSCTGEAMLRNRGPQSLAFRPAASRACSGAH